MKIVGKIFSFLIVLLILLFSILSVSGFSYYFGDNKVTVIKGFRDIKLAEDLEGGIKFTLESTSADEIYYDAETIVDIVEERAALAGFTDYRMYINDATGNVEFIISNNLNSEFDAIEYAAFLTCIGDITIRENSDFLTYNVDSSGSGLFTDYYGTESEPVIMERRYISGASAVTRKVDGETLHCLDIKFNEEGKLYLSQITDPTASSDLTYYNSTISLWIDNRMLAYDVLTEHLTDGVLTISDESFTPSKTKLYAAVINSDPMLLNVSDIDYVDGSNISFKMVTLTAGIILAVLAFVLIYRYRVNGVITLVSLVFQFALLLSVCTGFFKNGKPIIMDMSAVCGFVIALMLTVINCSVVSERMKKLCSSEVFDKSLVSKAFKLSGLTLIDINVVIAIISFVGFIMFGTSGFAVSLFGNAVCGGIYKFSLILLIGTGFNIITSFILPYFLAANLKNIKLLSKPSMFGGKKNEN